MNCNNCGESLNKGDKFCKVCGSLVTPDFSKCPECGESIKENDRFCRTCGHKIDRESFNKEAFISSNKNAEKVNDFPNFDELDQEEVDFDYRTPYDDLYKDNPKIVRKSAFASLLSNFGKKKYKNSDKSKKTHKTQNTTNKSVKKDDVSVEKSFVRDDFTSELPDLSKVDESIETRKKLSDKKKKLLEESKEKAGNNENFILDEPSDSDLMQTQKIDLSEIQRIETEIRKVRVKEEKQKEEENLLNKDIEVKKKKKKEKVKKVKPKVKKENNRTDDNGKLGKYLIPILLCLALIFASGAYLTAKTNKNSVIKNFENAVINKDYIKTASLIAKADNSAVEEVEIEAFVKLMNENDIFKSSLIGAIKEDSIKLTKNSDYESNRVYRLEKVGKKYLFFNDYKIVLDTVNTNLTANDGITYTFAGKEYTGSAREVMLIPGKYILSQGEDSFDVNVSNTNPNFDSGVLVLDINDLDFIVVESNDEEDITEEETEIEKTDIQGDVNLYLESPEKAQVYINGKDTGLTVAEFNLLDGVDIKQGDKIQVKEEFPWGFSFSDEYTYDGEASIYLEANLNSEDNMQVIMDKVVQLLKEDEEARRKMSMDPFTSIIEPELSSANSLIDSEIDSDIIYYRNYKSMEFDPESFDIYSNEDGSYTAYIGGVITYDTTEVSPEDLDSVEGQELSEIRGFHLTYLPDKDWFVNLWGYTERYINTDNLIEVTVD